MRRATISALTIAAALFAQAEAVHACACCTEPGQRMDTTDTMDTYVRGELAQMRFATQATLYNDTGFPDSVSGIVNPSTGLYRSRAAIRGVVRFDFVDPAGRPGRVQFLLPRLIHRFEVDPRSTGGPPPPNGPGLYKEWRLTGPAQLSGFAAGAGNAATATLIMHGDGNSCSSSANFKHWTLAVKGRGIAFTFLGVLVP